MEIFIAVVLVLLFLPAIPYILLGLFYLVLGIIATIIEIYNEPKIFLDSLKSILVIGLFLFSVIGIISFAITFLPFVLFFTGASILVAIVYKIFTLFFNLTFIVLLNILGISIVLITLVSVIGLTLPFHISALIIMFFFILLLLYLTISQLTILTVIGVLITYAIVSTLFVLFGVSLIGLYLYTKLLWVIILGFLFLVFIAFFLFSKSLSLVFAILIVGITIIFGFFKPLINPTSYTCIESKSDQVILIRFIKEDNALIKSNIELRKNQNICFFSIGNNITISYVVEQEHKKKYIANGELNYID